MSSLNEQYTIEHLKRVRAWVAEDDGKIFWRWLKAEQDRLHDAAMMDENTANPIAHVLKNERRLAMELQARYIASFANLINDKIKSMENDKEQLTTIEEI